MKVTLTELGTAYRKAKVDLYYSTNSSLFLIADYESNLQENLKRLQKCLKRKSEKWVTEPEFLGTWTLAPKAIKTHEVKESHELGLIHAAPDDEWAALTEPEDKPTAEFRLMAKCSMDFHVLSALWMLRVGHLFDERLSNNVYGSRLRRGSHNELNELALGTFKPYLKPFREWRDGAIRAMRTALGENKKVLALTADVSSFYHRLNPAFMLDEEFHQLFGINLTSDQEELNRLFINALLAWAKNTPLETGLPVGLPASAVVANAALMGLDRFIEQQVVPLYYGRYVDDILLVMENTSGIKTTEMFWSWIFGRDGGKDFFDVESDPKSGEQSTLFKPNYLKESRIAFENNKNKLFVLSGGPGKALIDAVNEQVNQRASEWRALPDLPENPDTIATDLLKATNHAGEQADNLRKADALTLHRAGFALSLRDYEAYERDLPPRAWEAQRHAFFAAVNNHLLTPIKFFELAQYLPRIIRLAVACKDFKILGDLLHNLKTLMERVEQGSTPYIKPYGPDDSPSEELFRCWCTELNESVAESIISALPPRVGSELIKQWDQHVASHWHRISEDLWSTGNEWKRMYPQELEGLLPYQFQLFSFDLAHLPLRFIGLPREITRGRGIPSRSKLVKAAVVEVLSSDVEQGTEILAEWIGLKKKRPSGLYFATRPFGLQELYLIAQEPFSQENQDPLNQVVLALRGFCLKEHKMPRWSKKGQVLKVPDGQPSAKHNIAVASWKTSGQSFTAAVMKKQDPESRWRYQRLNRLINELISRPGGAGYLVLPELALPPRWFMRIADKLKGRGISLITGVEYLHERKGEVRNQVWASLTHDGLGFPSLMLYRQDKQTPALHEEAELHRLAGVQMVPAVHWKKPPIIKHGNFRFGLMICSELTNIRYRGNLRGKVDALFVPEWNSDTETFNALVESAALDIHAYIVQCNNRTYGDSRIRAPYKDRWKRDVLRVKGGNHDYCITGEIDIQALRQFQSCHRSPSQGFKPVPDGFAEDMSSDREILPRGGEG